MSTMRGHTCSNRPPPKESGTELVNQSEEVHPEVGAHHEEGAVGEVDDGEEAEDQREPDCEENENRSRMPAGQADQG